MNSDRLNRLGRLAGQLRIAPILTSHHFNEIPFHRVNLPLLYRLAPPLGFDGTLPLVSPLLALFRFYLPLTRVSSDPLLAAPISVGPLHRVPPLPTLRHASSRA